MKDHTAYPGDSDNKVLIVLDSGKQMQINCSASQYLSGIGKYRTGGFIQDAFVFLNADEREFLLSGLYPEEWPWPAPTVKADTHNANWPGLGFKILDGVRIQSSSDPTADTVDKIENDTAVYIHGASDDNDDDDGWSPTPADARLSTDIPVVQNSGCDGTGGCNHAPCPFDCSNDNCPGWVETTEDTIERCDRCKLFENDEAAFESWIEAELLPLMEVNQDNKLLLDTYNTYRKTNQKFRAIERKERKG